MTWLAPAVLTVGVFLYIFFPQRRTQFQAHKTRLEFLRERKDVVYENLRDLNFEYRAGKYPEEDFVAQRAGLENEATQIIAEIEFLENNFRAV